MKGNKGFTMTEMLAACLILALLAAFLAVGIPAAMRVRREATAQAEASTLCATLSAALSDELHFATGIHTEEDTVYFDSTSYGADVTVSSPDGHILIGGRELLGEKSYTGDLRSTVALSYEGGSFHVALSIVGAKGGDAQYQWAQAEFTVQPIN